MSVHIERKYILEWGAEIGRGGRIELWRYARTWDGYAHGSGRTTGPRGRGKSSHEKGEVMCMCENMKEGGECLFESV